jgi:uncharacterized protein YjbI with pentapeptide repeats
MTTIKHRITGAVLLEHDAPLRGAYLRGAYLRGADLREAGLSGADLSGADLREADLREADLSGADLSGADLREAYLREAGLSEASMIHAGARSDGYEFYAHTRDGVLWIKAGCRYFTLSEANRHWLERRGDTPLGDESLALCDNAEKLAKIRGMI